jgi:hypothetical protein
MSLVRDRLIGVRRQIEQNQACRLPLYSCHGRQTLRSCLEHLRTLEAIALPDHPRLNPKREDDLASKLNRPKPFPITPEFVSEREFYAPPFWDPTASWREVEIPQNNLILPSSELL